MKCCTPFIHTIPDRKLHNHTMPHTPLHHSPYTIHHSTIHLTPLHHTPYTITPYTFFLGSLHHPRAVDTKSQYDCLMVNLQTQTDGVCSDIVIVCWLSGYYLFWYMVSVRISTSLGINVFYLTRVKSC